MSSIKVVAQGMVEARRKNLLIIVLGEYYFSVLVLVGIIIFSASYFFYFRNEINKLGFGGEFDAGRFEDELSARREVFKNLNDSLAVLNSVSKSDKEKIDRLLPAVPDEPSIIASLSSIIRDSGMVLLSIDVKSGFEAKGAVVKGLKTVEVTLGFGGGDYVGFKNLLGNMEKNLRIMNVESLAYNPGSSAYSVRLRAYYLE